MALARTCATTSALACRTDGTLARAAVCRILATHAGRARESALVRRVPAGDTDRAVRQAMIRLSVPDCWSTQVGLRQDVAVAEDDEDRRETAACTADGD